jgi:hypothetical protein
MPRPASGGPSDQGEASCTKPTTSREHAIQVEFLLVAGVTDGRFNLAADRKHRRMIQLAVVEAGDQVGRPGAAG